MNKKFLIYGLGHLIVMQSCAKETVSSNMDNEEKKKANEGAFQENRWYASPEMVEQTRGGALELFQKEISDLLPILANNDAFENFFDKLGVASTCITDQAKQLGGSNIDLEKFVENLYVFHTISPEKLEKQVDLNLNENDEKNEKKTFTLFPRGHRNKTTFKYQNTKKEIAPIICNYSVGTIHFALGHVVANHELNQNHGECVIAMPFKEFVKQNKNSLFGGYIEDIICCGKVIIPNGATIFVDSKCKNLIDQLKKFDLKIISLATQELQTEIRNLESLEIPKREQIVWAAALKSNSQKHFSSSDLPEIIKNIYPESKFYSTVHENTGLFHLSSLYEILFWFYAFYFESNYCGYVSKLKNIINKFAIRLDHSYNGYIKSMDRVCSELGKIRDNKDTLANIDITTMVLEKLNEFSENHSIDILRDTYYTI